MVDAFAASDASNNERLFVLPVLRDQYPHRFPDNLLGLVSEEPLGCAVPAGDSAVEVLADNCVVGRLNDGCKALQQYMAIFLRGRLDQLVEAKPDECAAAE